MQNLNNCFFFSSEISEKKIVPNSLEHAYLLILNDELKNAKKVFKLNDSPRSRWGVILCEILEGYLYTYPTYFQIRNFYEIDLDFLIKNEKIEYVERLLGVLEPFVLYNQEIYKYAARVMLENKFPQLAYKYLQESKRLHYNDPELLFMLAKFYIDNNDYRNAYYYVNECQKLLPEYYPAKVLKQKIEELQK